MCKICKIRQDMCSLQLVNYTATQIIFCMLLSCHVRVCSIQFPNCRESFLSFALKFCINYVLIKEKRRKIHNFPLIEPHSLKAALQFPRSQFPVKLQIGRQIGQLKLFKRNSTKEIFLKSFLVFSENPLKNVFSNFLGVCRFQILILLLK